MLHQKSLYLQLWNIRLRAKAMTDLTLILFNLVSHYVTKIPLY